MATKVIFIKSGTSFVVPSDWNSASNTVEVLGAGSAAAGAYSFLANLALTPGSTVACGVGSPSSGVGVAGDTFFVSVATILAKGANGVTGGQASAGVGSIKFSGGNAGSNGGGRGGGGGGGGAGGPHGNGGSGGSGAGGGAGGGGGGGGADGGTNGAGSGSQNGGTGGNNRLGTGGGVSVFEGTNGGPGTNGGGGSGGFGGDNRNDNIAIGGIGSFEPIWTQTSDGAKAGPGSGGGGGGGDNSAFNAQANGGTPGGFGGGGGLGGIGASGGAPNASGTPGIIVLTYTSVPPHVDLLSGTLSLVGEVLHLSRQILLGSGSGTFALIGENIKLTRKPALASKIFGYVGNPETLTRKPLLPHGTFTLTGEVLLKAKPLFLPSNSYNITGEVVKLQRHPTLHSGIFHITGSTILAGGRTSILLNTGMYTLLPVNIGQRFSLVRPLTRGLYNLLGIDQDIEKLNAVGGDPHSEVPGFYLIQLPLAGSFVAEPAEGEEDWVPQVGIQGTWKDE